MNPNTRDQAGPLWQLMEDFFESLPIPPWLFLLASLAFGILAVLAITKRKKS